MSISDLFATPVLVCLGICLSLIGLLGMFFMQKIMEQNHKISSMFGLVTTMEDELNFLISYFVPAISPKRQNFHLENVMSSLVNVEALTPT